MVQWCCSCPARPPQSCSSKARASDPTEAACPLDPARVQSVKCKDYAKTGNPGFLFYYYKVCWIRGGCTSWDGRAASNPGKGKLLLAYHRERLACLSPFSKPCSVPVGKLLTCPKCPSQRAHHATMCQPFLSRLDVADMRVMLCFSGNC